MGSLDNYSNPMTPELTGASPSAKIGKPAAPWEAAQHRLNRFVRTVAVMERFGNGLGTLAFMWATVVVLGGFSTDLGSDFWYATAIVFLEAFRVFSRQSRSDDQLLFKTTGGIRNKRVRMGRGFLYYLNAVIMIVCLSRALGILLDRYIPRKQNIYVLLFATLALASKLELSAYITRISTLGTISTATLVLRCGPVVSLLIFAIARVKFDDHPVGKKLVIKMSTLVLSWLLYNGLILSLRWQRLNRHRKLMNDSALKFCFVILSIMVVVCLILIFNGWASWTLFATFVLGNIQIPFAVVRIVLSSLRLFGSKGSHHETENDHLVPALKVFYSMVLAQGVLYIMACLSESLLSSRFRKSLAQHCGSDESVELYYEHSYDRYMEDGLLASEDLNIFRFAIDSLDSNTNEKKLAAVQILHSILEQEASKTALHSKIIACTKAVDTLISMLGWRPLEDDGLKIKLFAAKITTKLAGDLQIVGIPGAIQKVSSLLDADYQSKEPEGTSAQKVVTNEQNIDKNKPTNDPTTTVDIEGDEAGFQPTIVQGKRSFGIRKGLQCIMSLMSLSEQEQKEVSKEGNEPWKDEDSFLILGMLILERLSYNLDNCTEISKAADLIPKIIRLMTCSANTSNISETHQRQRVFSSLKLVAKLASTKGEIGIVLRQKISEQPLLLNDLAEILEDSHSSTYQQELAICIIAKLSFNKETGQEIGSFQVIIHKLMHAFLNPNESPTMRMVVGQALLNLSIENASNFLVISEETTYELFENLKIMLQNYEYTYVAAGLLQNLCYDRKEQIWNPRSIEHLSSALPVVFETMTKAAGKQLEALMGLTSQMCKVIPKCFVRTLESHIGVEAFVQKLVVILNANKTPSPEYPRMRRVIVEMAISIVELCPAYAAIFRQQGMMEALCKVERAPSKVEKYRVFFGSIGVVLENGLPLPIVVARAKGLIISAATPTIGSQQGNQA
ncbi:unnamed protein product [Urochloa humidicola]